jgi:hypothetical protein
VRTNVYVDAFNLYYRAVKGTPYKWLDLLTLCNLALKKNQIHRIRYFTALIQPRPHDIQQAQRQQMYIRALETLPCVSVHYGSFLSNPQTLPLAQPITGLPRRVEVVRTEEKGSDVNLGALMLCDGYEGDYEVAVVISNDSDLAMPIELVRTRLKKPVILLCPSDKPNAKLCQAATFVKRIRKSVLKASQFSTTLRDENGTITKPDRW